MGDRTEPPAPLSLLLGGDRLPLRYVELDGGLYVIGTDAATEWPVQLLREGHASVDREGHRTEFSVELVADPAARNQILDRFRGTFGTARMNEWFPHPGRILRLAQLLSPAGDPYGRWLEGEFDAAAGEYVQRLSENPVERELRRRSVAFLLESFGARGHLLELGAGPGLETLPMLSEGHEVTAVDVSPKMIERLRDRARSAGVSERLTTAVLRLRDLASLPETTFDGAYSTFGALNCEPDLGPIVAALTKRLPEGAPLVAGSYNRWALPALGAQLATGHLRAAGARLGSVVPVGLSRFSVDWVPRSVRELREAFGSGFDQVSAVGLGWVAPPPESVGRLRSLPNLLRAVLRWDEQWQSSGVARAFADQVLLRMCRRGVARDGPGPGSG